MDIAWKIAFLPFNSHLSGFWLPMFKSAGNITLIIFKQKAKKQMIVI